MGAEEIDERDRDDKEGYREERVQRDKRRERMGAEEIEQRNREMTRKDTEKRGQKGKQR